MTLSKKQLTNLRRIAALAQKLISEQSSVKDTGKRKRIRRSGQELVRFRKQLKAERRKGVPVAEIARKHGVSSAYIYTLP